jgi:hypothetical protein
MSSILANITTLDSLTRNPGPLTTAINVKKISLQKSSDFTHSWYLHVESSDGSTLDIPFSSNISIDLQIVRDAERA